MKRAYEEVLVCTDLSAFLVHYLFFSCFFIYFFFSIVGYIFIKSKADLLSTTTMAVFNY